MVIDIAVCVYDDIDGADGDRGGDGDGDGDVVVLILAVDCRGSDAGGGWSGRALTGWESAGAKNVLIRAPAVGLEKYFPVPEVRAGWLFLWQAAPDLTLLLLLLVLWAIASVTSLVQKWGTGTVYGLETRWDRGALGQRSLLYTPSSCAVPSSMNEATRGVSKATLTSCGPPSNQATQLKHFFSAHYGILT
ncbi:unnamed protein product [[Candida] boidinii]|uniref:Unnamed protein product n=1 Tax=Candida boidinii TaxID=5477 RepID=A0A9W6T0E8_CANBO|nr:unnamed protein product [[Candida] boidinii]GMF64281.1 unnamed protein product [[Candida] boidinii]GMF97790.1 unnamed protein product [[Candida] boidinii]